MTSRSRNPVLLLEGILLFVLVPGAYVLFGRGRPFFPVLWLIACYGLFVLLRDRSFARSAFRVTLTRANVTESLKLFLPVAVVMTVGVLVFRPDMFLFLPRKIPLLWCMIMVLYPLLSVYPQEIIYRAFFMHRYKPVFGSGSVLLYTGAILFGLHHLIFGNGVAVVLSTLGGIRFASTYRRNGNLGQAVFEHALYGCLIFSVGLGDLFYHGA